jgi:hypothetical protein
MHMKDSGPTIEGLLGSYRTKRFGDHYVVELAELAVAPGQTQELGGQRVRIPRENVSWVQEL